MSDVKTRVKVWLDKKVNAYKELQVNDSEGSFQVITFTGSEGIHMWDLKSLANVLDVETFVKPYTDEYDEIYFEWNGVRVFGLLKKEEDGE